MRYQVVVTFDLERADSEQYECVKEALHKQGLHTVVEGDKGRSSLPRNTFYGEISGHGAASTAASVREAVMKIIGGCGATGTVFVAAGGPDLSWEADTV